MTKQYRIINNHVLYLFLNKYGEYAVILQRYDNNNNPCGCIGCHHLTTGQAVRKLMQYRKMTE